MVCATIKRPRLKVLPVSCPLASSSFHNRTTNPTIRTGTDPIQHASSFPIHLPYFFCGTLGCGPAPATSTRLGTHPRGRAIVVTQHARRAIAVSCRCGGHERAQRHGVQAGGRWHEDSLSVQRARSVSVCRCRSHIKNLASWSMNHTPSSTR
jgi:hypothetical protein